MLAKANLSFPSGVFRLVDGIGVGVALTGVGVAVGVAVGTNGTVRATWAVGEGSGTAEDTGGDVGLM
jgi:hypothetical protein